MYYGTEIICTLVLRVFCPIFCLGNYCFVGTVLSFSPKEMKCYTHVLYFDFIHYFIALLLLVRG